MADKIPLLNLRVSTFDNIDSCLSTLLDFKAIKVQNNTV